jgi:hypothetical protein
MTPQRKYLLGLLGMGLVCVGLAVHGLKTGKVKLRSTDVYRDKQPSLFFGVVFFLLGLGALSFLAALVFSRQVTT